MPSSLTRVFPRTLGFSPRLPVSVCGTGTCHLVRSFSRQCGPSGFALPEGLAPGQLSASCRRDLPLLRPAAFDALFQPRARTAPCVTPSSNGPMRYRNFRLLSFAYACCLGLGPDLPRADDRCPGNLRLSVGRILTVLFATHTGILTAALSTCPSGHASPMAVRSPTHVLGTCRGFGSVLEPRVSSAQDLSASELLRTLLMVAASEPTSWLSSNSYILPHLARHLGP